MDDARATAWSSIALTLTLLVSAAGWAQSAGIEYISPEQKTALADSFSSAAFGEKETGLLGDHPSWTCDLYGVRSGMQVRRGVALYQFKADQKGKWSNRGAGPAGTYRIEQGSLVGKSDKVEDQVRVTSAGRLIGRMTAAKSPQTVLAYSVCTSR